MIRLRLFFLVMFFTAASHEGAAAPRFVCYPVRPGDTASQLALRLTGNEVNRDAAWFQILDSQRSRFIPKRYYSRILPDWQACIAMTSARVQPQGVTGLMANEYAFAWWFIPLFLVVAGWITAQYLDRREATLSALRQFGEAFIQEFERPLIQQPGVGPALQSRLHIVPDRKRLEIHFAPNEGRHYPNLSDHRKNVEYDVDRVVQVLGDKRFVSDHLAARGAWVVIPFRFERRVKQEGGP